MKVESNLGGHQGEIDTPEHAYWSSPAPLRQMCLYFSSELNLSINIMSEM